MEGISGIVSNRERLLGAPEFAAAGKWLVADVNAAIEGALEKLGDDAPNTPIFLPSRRFANHVSSQMVIPFHVNSLRQSHSATSLTSMLFSSPCKENSDVNSKADRSKPPRCSSQHPSQDARRQGPFRPQRAQAWAPLVARCHSRRIAQRRTKRSTKPTANSTSAPRKPRPSPKLHKQSQFVLNPMRINSLKPLHQPRHGANHLLLSRGPAALRPGN